MCPQNIRFFLQLCLVLATVATSTLLRGGLRSNNSNNIMSPSAESTFSFVPTGLDETVSSKEEGEGQEVQPAEKGAAQDDQELLYPEGKPEKSDTKTGLVTYLAHFKNPLDTAIHRQYGRKGSKKSSLSQYLDEGTLQESF